MNEDTLKAATRLSNKIGKLKHFLGTVESMQSLCAGYGASESPESTVRIKEILRADFKAQLAQAEAEFAKM